MNIKESDFSECSFVDVKVKNMVFDDVNFTKAEFLKSSLNGVDFSTSNITEVYDSEIARLKVLL